MTIVRNETTSTRRPNAIEFLGLFNKTSPFQSQHNDAQKV